MKKIWKMRKDAVSPVIATILMVAITVVLAAVLYVMVMGFGGTPGQQVTGSFTGTPQTITNGKELTFGVISPETNFVDCKVVVILGGAAATAQTISLAAAGNTFGAPHSCYVTFTDLGGDGKISNGDSLMIRGGTSAAPVALGAGSYTVSILLGSTGSEICAQSFTI